MGKKHKLNRFIKWIKSDLPEETSSVLLLSITRIPSSPTPARRPCSLPIRGTPYSSYPPPDSPPESESAKWSLETVNTQSRNSESDILSGTTSGACSNVTLSHFSSSNEEKTRRRDADADDNDDEVDVKSDSKNNLLLATSDSDCSPFCDENTSSRSDSLALRTSSSHAPDILQNMDRSVDSIGTCSLDVDASVENPDWSGGSSIGTLRSASILSTPPAVTAQEKRLPSYLSLACTVNGYSTITNYDSCRLARSREVSPHRPNISHDQPNLRTNYQRNSLSPSDNMSSNNNNNTVNHQEYFRSTKTMSSYTSSSKTQTNFVYKKETVINGGGSVVQNSFSNGKTISETTIQQHNYTNGQGGERKSFIQQRVERLYGPGALAQGFFVSKRQRNSTSEGENNKLSVHNKENNEQHSKSFTNNLLRSGDDDVVVVDGDQAETSVKMKQSASSPALPVLRHLRPEFRAQLPIISPRKYGDCTPVSTAMQKSRTVPVLKTQTTTSNGHAVEKVVSIVVPTIKDAIAPSSKESGTIAGDVKDGHHFLRILEKETKRLFVLAEKAERELEQDDLPEDAKGYLRSASGKARLLASQKMQQFEGLCRNNITQDENVQFPTTNEDLQGFWDMVLLQVVQVDKIYEELDVLRANGWKEEEKSVDVTDSTKARKLIPRARPQTAASEAARKAREAARKQMIEDRRKAMRNQTQGHQSIEIFVPETTTS